jgi:hypothetical protein
MFPKAIGPIDIGSSTAQPVSFFYFIQKKPALHNAVRPDKRSLSLSAIFRSLGFREKNSLPQDSKPLHRAAFVRFWRQAQILFFEILNVFPRQKLSLS